MMFSLIHYGKIHKMTKQWKMTVFKIIIVICEIECKLICYKISFLIILVQHVNILPQFNNVFSNILLNLWGSNWTCIGRKLTSNKISKIIDGQDVEICCIKCVTIYYNDFIRKRWYSRLFNMVWYFVVICIWVVGLL